jgi:hypothetical protein
MNIKEVKDFRITKTLDDVVALEGLYEVQSILDKSPRSVWMGLLVWFTKGNFGLNEINNSDLEFTSFADFKNVAENVSPKKLDWDNIITLDYCISK